MTCIYFSNCAVIAETTLAVAEAEMELAVAQAEFELEMAELMAELEAMGAELAAEYAYMYMMYMNHANGILQDKLEAEEDLALAQLMQKGNESVGSSTRQKINQDPSQEQKLCLELF